MLVTLIEAVDYLAQTGVRLRAVDTEMVYQQMRKNDIESSDPLIEDRVLSDLSLRLVDAGVDVSLLRDGETDLQIELLSKYFLDFYSRNPSVFTSQALGVNKLSPEYYLECTRRLEISPGELLVVGDRPDKDIDPAKWAGCEALLVVGDSELKCDRVDLSKFSLQCDLGAEKSETMVCNLVLGRFQPLHVEHCEYIVAAIEASDHLIVGITNRYPEEGAESGEGRSEVTNNPLPFWLRSRILRRFLEQQLSGSEKALEILPFILNRKNSSH